MLTENHSHNGLVSPSTSSESPVHLARNASQLIVHTSVHHQKFKWRADFISILPLLKASDFNDQPESKRSGSIAFWHTGCRSTAVGTRAKKPVGGLRLDAGGFIHSQSPHSFAAKQCVLPFEKGEPEGILNQHQLFRYKQFNVFSTQNVEPRTQYPNLKEEK